MANQYLTLSLFMMMLSFFIILNAISEYEETKAKSVMNSVAIAFSKQAQPDNLLPEEEEDPLQGLNSGSALDQIQALFTDRISGVKVAKNRFGTQMKIRMSVRDFEKMLAVPVPENAADIDPATTKSLLPVLLSLLDSQNDVPYRMDVLLHSSKTADLENAGESVRNVATYVTRIRDTGLPNTLVSAGLTPGNKDVIDLIFKRYVPFNPAPGRAAQRGGR